MLRFIIQIEIMKMSKKPIQKIKHQIKSGKYYIFWGAATIAVMAGQIYVGNGYRTMSESVEDLTKMMEIKFEYDLLKNSMRKMPVIQ
jgi:hypothetical protein|tara:strand:+ start:326 stop:586 length:261 start_codon:yes stop_codon:yes gene_type:complete